MTNYFGTVLSIDFESALQLVTDTLKEKGFGIVTEMDVQSIFKNKLEVDFRPYKILGACHPVFAHRALKINDKVGTLLPCNVIIQELESKDGQPEIEISIVDPLAAFSTGNNNPLEYLAVEVSKILEDVIREMVKKTIAMK